MVPEWGSIGGGSIGDETKPLEVIGEGCEELEPLSMADETEVRTIRTSNISRLCTEIFFWRFKASHLLTVILRLNKQSRRCVQQ